MSENPITVLVVDDLARVRDAVTTMLTINSDIEVVGAAGDGHEAIQRARDLRPDVVIMDLEMPVMDGCAATEQIVAEGLSSVIVLSMHADPVSRARALTAGASAFIEKCDASDKLVPLLRATRDSAAPAPAQSHPKRVTGAP